MSSTLKSFHQISTKEIQIEAPIFFDSASLSFLPVQTIVVNGQLEIPPNIHPANLEFTSALPIQFIVKPMGTTALVKTIGPNLKRTIEFASRLHSKNLSKVDIKPFKVKKVQLTQIIHGEPNTKQFTIQKGNLKPIPVPPIAFWILDSPKATKLISWLSTQNLTNQY